MLLAIYPPTILPLPWKASSLATAEIRFGYCVPVCLPWSCLSLSSRQQAELTWTEASLERVFLLLCIVPLLPSGPVILLIMHVRLWLALYSDWLLLHGSFSHCPLACGGGQVRHSGIWQLFTCHMISPASDSVGSSHPGHSVSRSSVCFGEPWSQNGIYLATESRFLHSFF